MEQQGYPKSMSSTVLEQNPAFANSEEYLSLVEDGMDDLHGVVLGQFGKFLVRVMGDNAVSQQGFTTLEKLLALNNPRITEAVTVEIFEVRWEPKPTVLRFFQHLGPRSQALYRESYKAVAGVPWD